MAAIRGVLYMAAMVASRCSPELFATKLKERGKPIEKVLVTAVARKLLVSLNAMAASRHAPE